MATRSLRQHSPAPTRPRLALRSCVRRPSMAQRIQQTSQGAPSFQQPSLFAPL